MTAQFSFLWLEGVAAVLEDFGVVVDAEDQLLVGGTVLGDEFAQRVLVAVPGFFLVVNKGLVLAHEVAGHIPGESAKGDEGGDEKPAVALGGAVVGEFEDFVHAVLVE